MKRSSPLFEPYQGSNLPIDADNNCGICHTVEMEDSVYHPNMLHEFRSRQVMRTIQGPTKS